MSHIQDQDQMNLHLESMTLNSLVLELRNALLGLSLEVFYQVVRGDHIFNSLISTTVIVCHLPKRIYFCHI